ncbi:FHA domain-containing serine/threonine-protein kinase [Planctomycetota bacterium]
MIGRRIGQYSITHKLAEGGMGAVFSARSRSGQRVALKVLKPRLANDEIFRGRFFREADIALSLSHPNIVATIDAGEDGDRLYLVSEFVDGGDLKRLIERSGALEEIRALKIMRGVVSALEYAHGMGLIHRDVKPANVMLAAGEVAKLTDLGMARPTDESVTRFTLAGEIVGTPHYLAPEQALGSAELDIRCDLYAVGVTLYELLVGMRPYVRDTIGEIIKAHVTDPVPDPREFAPHISVPVRRLVLDLLEKIPDRRPRTPKRVLERLDAMIQRVDRGHRAALRDGVPRTGMRQGVPTERMSGWNAGDGQDDRGGQGAAESARSGHTVPAAADEDAGVLPAGDSASPTRTLDETVDGFEGLAELSAQAAAAAGTMDEETLDEFEGLALSQSAEIAAEAMDEETLDGFDELVPASAEVPASPGAVGDGMLAGLGEAGQLGTEISPLPAAMDDDTVGGLERRVQSAVEAPALPAAMDDETRDGLEELVPAALELAGSAGTADDGTLDGLEEFAQPEFRAAALVQSEEAGAAAAWLSAPRAYEDEVRGAPPQALLGGSTEPCSVPVPVESAADEPPLYRATIVRTVPRRMLLIAIGATRLHAGRDSYHRSGNDVALRLLPSKKLREANLRISPSHVLFELREDAVYLTDMASANGTRLDDVRLSAGQPYRLDSRRANRIVVGGGPRAGGAGRPARTLGPGAHGSGERELAAEAEEEPHRPHVRPGWCGFEDRSDRALVLCQRAPRAGLEEASGARREDHAGLALPALASGPAGAYWWRVLRVPPAASQRHDIGVVA